MEEELKKLRVAFVRTSLFFMILIGTISLSFMGHFIGRTNSFTVFNTMLTMALTAIAAIAFCNNLLKK